MDAPLDRRISGHFTADRSHHTQTLGRRTVRWAGRQTAYAQTAGSQDRPESHACGEAAPGEPGTGSVSHPHGPVATRHQPFPAHLWTHSGLNRKLYHLQLPVKRDHPKKEMPFKAVRRHQYWTTDIRYLDMHQLGGGMIYCISILENFSRAILASAISHRQDTEAYLAVLYTAIRKHGCPPPAEVLGWVKGMQPEPERIYRAFSAVGEMRTITKAGYVRFRDYLLYGEWNLAGERALVNMFQDVLTLEYQEQPLSRYSVE